MLVYHGTPSLFTEFDYSRIGQHGSSEGKGFYFTDSKEVATRYADNGYILTVEFNGKKSLHYTKNKISKQQLKNYLRELHKTTGCLCNYDDVDHRGIDRALSSAIEIECDNSTNDVDMICSIINGCGNVENGLKTLYRVLGYDSVQVTANWGEQNLYIALTNDIIKIVNVESINDLRRISA